MNADETIYWIKNQLNGDTPLRTMYKARKSDIMVMWAEAVDQQISEGKLDMKTNQISNYIRKELIAMKLDGAVHIMYHALSPKYKSITPPQYEDMILENSNETSSAEPINYSKENSTLIEITKNIKDSIKTLESLLESTEIISNCPPNFVTEVTQMSKVVMQKAKFCQDGREKVAQLDHVLSLELAASCTLNSIFSTLTGVKMKQSTITSKQMGKIVAMRIKDAYITLRPSTEQQAIQQGWSGIACEGCGEFRVAREYNTHAVNFMDHCVTCDNWQDMTLSPVIQK